MWSPCGDVAVCLVPASNQEAVTPLPPTPRHAGGDSPEALEVGGWCGRQESPGERDASLLHPRSGASQTRALHSGRRRQQARPPGASAYSLCWPPTRATTTCARDWSSTALPGSSGHGRPHDPRSADAARTESDAHRCPLPSRAQRGRRRPRSHSSRGRGC